MWFVRLNDEKMILNKFKKPVSESIVFKDEPTREIIREAIIKTKKVLFALQQDKITWCKGILLSGKARVIEQSKHYVVVKDINPSIIYMHNPLEIERINFLIEQNGYLFIGFKD